MASPKPVPWATIEADLRYTTLDAADQDAVKRNFLLGVHKYASETFPDYKPEMLQQEAGALLGPAKASLLARIVAGVQPLPLPVTVGQAGALGTAIKEDVWPAAEAAAVAPRKPVELPFRLEVPAETEAERVGENELDLPIAPPTAEAKQPVPFKRGKVEQARETWNAAAARARVGELGLEAMRDTKLLPMALEADRLLRDREQTGQMAKGLPGAVQAAIGSAEQMGEAYVTAFPAALVGGKVGATIAMTTHYGGVEAGQLYLDMVNRGVSPAMARKIAVPAGAVFGFIESAVDAVLPGNADKMLAKASIKKPVLNFALNLALKTGVESVEEATQALTESAAQNVATALTPGITSEGYQTLRESVGNAASQGVQAILPSALLMGAGAGAKAGAARLTRGGGPPDGGPPGGGGTPDVMVEEREPVNPLDPAAADRVIDGLNAVGDEMEKGDVDGAREMARRAWKNATEAEDAMSRIRERADGRMGDERPVGRYEAAMAEQQPPTTPDGTTGLVEALKEAQRGIDTEQQAEQQRRLNEQARDAETALQSREAKKQAYDQQKRREDAIRQLAMEKGITYPEAEALTNEATTALQELDELRSRSDSFTEDQRALVAEAERALLDADNPAGARRLMAGLLSPQRRTATPQPRIVPAPPLTPGPLVAEQAAPGPTAPPAGVAGQAPVRPEQVTGGAPFVPVSPQVAPVQPAPAAAAAPVEPPAPTKQQQARAELAAKYPYPGPPFNESQYNGILDAAAGIGGQNAKIRRENEAFLADMDRMRKNVIKQSPSLAAFSAPQPLQPPQPAPTQEGQPRAEAVREDQGEVPANGDAGRPGAGARGPGLQRDAEVAQEPAEAVQQAPQGQDVGPRLTTMEAARREALLAAAQQPGLAPKDAAEFQRRAERIAKIAASRAARRAAGQPGASQPAAAVPVPEVAPAAGVRQPKQPPATRTVIDKNLDNFQSAVRARKIRMPKDKKYRKAFIKAGLLKYSTTDPLASTADQWLQEAKDSNLAPADELNEFDTIGRIMRGGRAANTMMEGEAATAPILTAAELEVGDKFPDEKGGKPRIVVVKEPDGTIITMDGRQRTHMPDAEVAVASAVEPATDAEFESAVRRMKGPLPAGATDWEFGQEQEPEPIAVATGTKEELVLPDAAPAVILAPPDASPAAGYERLGYPGEDQYDVAMELSDDDRGDAIDKTMRGEDPTMGDYRGRKEVLPTEDALSVLETQVMQKWGAEFLTEVQVSASNRQLTDEQYENELTVALQKAAEPTPAPAVPEPVPSAPPPALTVQQQVAAALHQVADVMEGKPAEVPAPPPAQTDDKMVIPGDGTKPGPKDWDNALASKGLLYEGSRGKKRLDQTIREAIPNRTWLTMKEISDRAYVRYRGGGRDLSGAVTRDVTKWADNGILERRWKPDGDPVYAWTGTEPTAGLLTKEQAAALEEAPAPPPPAELPMPGPDVRAETQATAAQQPADAYDAARGIASAASREFRKAQQAYRARTIGNSEFLAAKAVHDKAMADFDAAETAFIDTTNATPSPSPAETTPHRPETPAAPAVTLEAASPAQLAAEAERRQAAELKQAQQQVIAAKQGERIIGKQTGIGQSELLAPQPGETPSLFAGKSAEEQNKEKAAEDENVRFSILERNDAEQAAATAAGAGKVSPMRVARIVARRFPGAWKAGSVKVVNTWMDLDPDIFPSHNPTRIRGWYDRLDGMTYVVAGNMVDEADVADVVAHEIVGHRGVDRVIGMREADRLFRKLQGEFGDELRELATNHGVKLVTREGKKRLASEILADLAGKLDGELLNQPRLRRMWNRLVALVRMAVRRLGYRGKFSETEVRDLLTRAQDMAGEPMPASVPGRETFGVLNREYANPKFSVADTEEINDATPRPVWVVRTIDTAAATGEEEARVSGAGIVKDGRLVTWHSTKTPQKFIEDLRKSQDLTEWGKDWDDLGKGMYSSSAPDFWRGRDTSRLDWLQNLAEKDKLRLADILQEKIAGDRKTGYISAGEADYATRAIEALRTGHNYVDVLAGQPYNVPLGDKAWIAEHGFTPTESGGAVEIHLKGRFAEVAVSRMGAPETRWLRDQGYSGAFTQSGFSTNPQLVVWDRKAIVGAGLAKRNYYGDMRPTDQPMFSEREEPGEPATPPPLPPATPPPLPAAPTNEKTKPRRFPMRAKAPGATSEEAQADLGDRPEHRYTPISSKAELEARINAMVNDETVAQETKERIAELQRRDQFLNLEEGYDAYSLLGYYQRTGQYSEEADIITWMGERLTSHGQLIQMASNFFGKESPQSFVKRAKTFLETQYGKTLTEEQIKAIVIEAVRIQAITDLAARGIAKAKLIDATLDAAGLSGLEWWDAYRYSNMLFNPGTQERNLFPNLIIATLLRPGMRLASGDLTGAVRYEIGMAQNLGRAMNDAWEVWAERFDPDAASAGERTADVTFARARSKVKPKGAGKQAAWWTLNVTRRFMEAIDRFSASLVEYGEATRLLAEGRPVEESLDAAVKLGKTLIYREQLGIAAQDKNEAALVRALDYLGKKYMDLAWSPRTPRKVRIVARQIVPFIKFGTNLAKNQARMSPFGHFLVPGAGGKLSEQNREMARMGDLFTLLGMVASFMGAVAFRRPRDREAAALWDKEQKREFSLNLGGWSVPVLYMQPMGFAFLLPEAIRYSFAENPESVDENRVLRAAGALSHMGSYLMSSTPNQTITDLLQTGYRTQTERIEKIAANLASQYVPAASLQRWINGILDGKVRDAKTFGDYMRKTVAGLSKDVMPKLDIKGQPMERPGSAPYLPYPVTQIEPKATKPLKERMNFLRARAIAQKGMEKRARLAYRGKLPAWKVEAYINSISDPEVREDVRASYKADEARKLATKRRSRP